MGSEFSTVSIDVDRKNTLAVKSTFDQKIMGYLAY